MSEQLKKTIPILKTKRLILRAVTLEDSQEIFTLRTHPEVNRYIQRPRPKNLDEAKGFISKVNEGVDKGKAIYWGICLKEKNKLIGTITLWNFSEDESTAEIGYDLLPKYHGKGMMNEAIQAVLDYGFYTLDLKTIEAFTQNDNQPSIRVLKKKGFALDPKRKDPDNPKNQIMILKFDT